MRAEEIIVQLTATTNADLAFRIGDFETLTDGLDYAAKGETGCNFFSPRGQIADVLTYGDIRERALDLAVRLSASGLERGSRFGLIAETNADFVVFFYACQYAGLIPVPLPLSINLGGHESHVTRLRGMVSAAGLSAAMASIDLLHTLREAADGLGVDLIGSPDHFYNLTPRGGAPRAFEKSEACYLQYSSGSTTQPRGVIVTQRAITSNGRAIGQHGLCLRPGDRATSWLPLYHDMGLVGFCLAPMLSQVSIDYLATSTFALRPRTWLKTMSDHGGTISFSPTFGYELCVRRAAKSNGGEFDLSRWRIAGIGGEMVRPDVLDAFADTFGTCGFDKKAFLPSYGLAEATLAVSFTGIGAGVRVDRVDRDAYERTGKAVPADKAGSAASARSFVLCGRVMPGYEAEIRDDENQVLAERSIGRVCIKGPSLMDGYFRNAEATRAAILADGWLDTGDMGYLVDGEIVITGRRKDMIICNGRNIWPQDLEWAVETLPGVRSGCAAAFSVTDDTDEERVVVVVECYVNDPEKQQALVKDIAAIIHRTAGVHCEVVLVPARSLVYTSSGKLSRAAAKTQYLDGSIRLLHAEPIGPEPHMEQPRLAASAGA